MSKVEHDLKSILQEAERGSHLFPMSKDVDMSETWNTLKPLLKRTSMNQCQRLFIEGYHEEQCYYSQEGLQTMPFPTRPLSTDSARIDEPH